MTKDTGGPAFPHSRLGSDADGMTLRDYFAAMAMQAEMISGIHESEFVLTALRAYKMADVMMEARKI